MRFLAFQALTVNNLTVFLNKTFVITFFRLSRYLKVILKFAKKSAYRIYLINNILFVEKYNNT